MIEAGFIFPPSAKRQVIKSILNLSPPLLPTQMSVGEDEPGVAICDDLKSLEWLDARKSGFCLENNKCSYDIKVIEEFPIKITCFLETPTLHIQTLINQLAKCDPVFGFACLPDEREAKNRVYNKIGITSIESWVGRDINRSLPGLYWWTLISSSLAEKHSIPIAALSSVALEHVELPDALHVFRFYEKPEDWREAADVRKLTFTLPGIFDVEKAREAVAAAKTFLEHSAISRQWK